VSYMTYGTRVYRLDPVVLEFIKDELNGGYTLRIFVYPASDYQNPARADLARKGMHDVSVTFHYRGEDCEETCSKGAPFSLDDFVSSAFGVCSDDEDFYKISATITLIGEDGPTVEFNEYTKRVGDKWTAWSQGYTILTMHVSDSVAKSMMSRLESGFRGERV